MKMKSLKPWIPILFAALIVTKPLTASADLLVPRHSNWKYNNLNQDLGTDWRATNYNDNLWGGPLPGPLGSNNEAGLQLCASVINIGADGARYPVIYYRTTFSVGSVASYS